MARIRTPFRTTHLSVLALIGLIWIATSLTAPVAAIAQETDMAEAETALIEKILSAGEADPADFSQQFLDAVPMEDVNARIGELSALIGPVQSVTPSGEGHEVRTGTHRVRVQITLDGDGRIAGLFFNPPVQLSASVADAANALVALAGEPALLVTRNGEEIAGHRLDRALAVGSAFKLAVLKVLMDTVAAGAHAWDEVVTLEEKHKSLPSGELRVFPAGSPVTLHTAAAQMISASDNTATDLLMDVVGRDAVSAELGQFALTTRELLQLKADEAARNAFLDAQTDAERAEMVAGLEGQPLPAASAASGPHDPGIEWYVSAEKLCALIEAVGGLDLFSINPGLAEPDNWQSIAFKGGSETGVINLTTHLTAEDGTQYCAAFTLNRTSSINEQEVFSAYASLLASLADND